MKFMIVLFIMIKKNSRMINHLYIISSLRPCGPTSQLLSLISEQKKKGNINLYLIKQRQIKGHNLEDINIITSWIKLLKYLSNNKSRNTIIHSSGIVADFINLLIKARYWKRTISITTLRNVPWEDLPLSYGIIKGSILSIFHLLIIRFLIVVTCSRSVYNEYKKSLFSSKQLSSIDNCCTLKSIKTRNSNIAGNNSIKLISLSPLIKRKQVHNAIKFLNELDIDFVMDIYGEGDLSNEISDFCENNKKFNYMGYVDSNKILLENYDALVSLSVSEGLSNSIIECLCSGLYAILSPIPSHIYTSKLCANAIILNKNYKSSLAESLNKVKNSTYDNKELQRANQYFSKTRMANEYNDLYLHYIYQKWNYNK